ncbi:MAG: MFS transporter, partial [bacterium]|nr:MFS transporter [bacterium]
MPTRHETGPVADAMPSTVLFYLLAAMAAGTFTAAIYSVLGTFIVDEFEISRAQLGLVVALNTTTGGLVSPYVGRVVDRLGGGYSLQLLFLMAATSFALNAIAPVLAIVFLAALVGGVAQAFANPATNKVIAYRVPLEARATVTGIKQSGVQLALFFGGILLPTIAEALGWRWAFAIVALVSVIGAYGTHRSRHGVSSGAGESHVGGPPEISSAVRWLSIYGLLMGLSGGALFFLPLFAEEELGQSIRVAGLAVAVVGLTAVV